MNDVLKDVVAGSASGAAITIVGHPFDTVKVRLQTQSLVLNPSTSATASTIASSGIPPSSSSTSALPPKPPSPFRGGIDCLFRTIRNEGTLALYKGMASPMAQVPLLHAFIFAAFESAKRFFGTFNEPGAPLTMTQVSAAGAWSGLATTLIITPVELVKSRLQIQYGSRSEASLQRYSGPRDVIKQTIRRHGVKGLFRGTSVQILTMTPCFAVRFGVYEYLVRSMTPRGGSRLDVSPLSMLFAGGTAGVACWVVCFPQDLIKARIQVQPDDQPRKYRVRFYDGGFVDCWRQIVRKEGYIGLWRGFGTCAARAFPANAAGFLAYEWAAKLLT